MFSIGRTDSRIISGRCLSNAKRICISTCSTLNTLAASFTARVPSASTLYCCSCAWARRTLASASPLACKRNFSASASAAMRTASARSWAACFSASAATVSAMASFCAASCAAMSSTALARSARSVSRTVMTLSSSRTAAARALSASALASDSARDFSATAMARSCSANSMALRRSTSACSTAWALRISSFLISRSARMRFKSTSRLAAILASSASRFFCASCSAILASCSARRSAISRSCSNLAYSSSRKILRRVRSASKFFVLIAKSVSCSISLRFLRRTSMVSVSLVKPSASNAFCGLKNSNAVWSKPVRETVSSSKPFLNKSSDTTCCTFCTKSTRFSCNSSIAISAATARKESTNLPSTNSFNCSGDMVFMPNVWAAVAMLSAVGLTRT